MPPSVEPFIIVGYGGHPDHYKPPRVKREGLYRDLSTVMCVPTLKGLGAWRVIDSWLSMLTPPNQKFLRLIGGGMEVGQAYDQLIYRVLADPFLATWKYVLMVEEDNLMAPHDFITLVTAADKGNFDVLGGLYWTKGIDGCTQIWGDPKDPEENYRPLDPIDGKIVRCNGTGMGFTLFKLDLFRRMEPPWFETQDGLKGHGVWTQDLYFFSKARAAKMKLKIGVHCGIKIGHLDYTTGLVW